MYVVDRWSVEAGLNRSVFQMLTWSLVQVKAIKTTRLPNHTRLRVFLLKCCIL